MGRRTSPLTFLVLLALVAGFLPANAQILSKGSVVTLRSFNYPNRGLAPQNEASQILLPLQSSLFTSQLEWVQLVPGLDGRKTTVSLQSTTHDNTYWRHQNFLVYAQDFDGSQMFRKDASFRIVACLADEGAYSFESVNYPGYFLRHQGFVLKLHLNDGTELFRLDSTFFFNLVV